MAKTEFEIYPGQSCKKCGTDLETMSIVSFDEGSTRSYVLTGTCLNCGTENQGVLARKIPPPDSN